jgi:conjugative relaxase-like TrwC/TraI family protein
MLSLKNVSAQRGKGYYGKEEGTRPSSAQWFGKGTCRIDLNPDIEPADFEKILEGRGRSGEPLSARKINLETRRAATDFTFSAPKSVSIAALVQGDMRVIDAHDQAVRSVLTVIEEQYARTRIRTDEGQIKVSTDNLVVAIFRHETSREQEPQLHSHALVMNCTQRGNGRWQSLSNDLIVNHSKFLGQVYQNELAHQLKEEGYEIKQRANGQFELEGYDELIGMFSTRRQQIERHLAPLEAPTLKQREHAALTTRPAKVQVPSDVLTLQWAETLLTIDQPLPPIPKPSDRTDLSQTLAKVAIAYLEERGNGLRIGAAEKYVVENFTGQTSLANLRNALKEEAVVVDDLTGLMSQPSVTQELGSSEVIESGQEEAKDSLQELNETIASNFAMHEQLMSWHQAEAARKANRLKGDAPTVETAQWLPQDVSMEPEPIPTLFNLPSDPELRVESAEVSLEALEPFGKVNDESSIKIEAAEPGEIIEVADVEPFYLEPLTEEWGQNLVDEAVEASLETEAETAPKDEDPTEVAEFIAEVTRATVQYFRDKVKQGAGAAVDGNMNVVENSNYRVEYHYNEESGKPPRLIVEETTTNTPLFEIVRGAEGWEVEIVKPEAREWLEAANRELAEERRLEPEIRKSQMEL